MRKNPPYGGFFLFGLLVQARGAWVIGGKKDAVGVLSRFRFIFHSAFSFF